MLTSPALVSGWLFRFTSCIVPTLLLPFLTLTAGEIASAQQDASAQERVSESYGRLPLAFEANEGQASSEVRYLARGADYMLLIGETDAVLARRRIHPCKAQFRDVNATKTHCREEDDLFHMQLLGTQRQGGADRAVRGEEMLPGKVNTLLGNDPKQWHAGASTYRRVRIAEAYPGIDLVYYGDQERLEYDFDVAPGADPKAIQFRFTGGRLRLNHEGDLVARVRGEDVIFRRPEIYQRVGGIKRKIAGGFVLEGGQTLRFRVGRYDRRQPLIIDPVLSYSTDINGTYALGGIAVNAAGEVYITGVATAISPTPGAYQQTDKNQTGFGGNAYVMKLNASGTNVVYATYLGGSGGFQILPPPYAAGDAGTAIAVDTSGDAYLTGFTYSQDFPTMNPVQAQNNGVDDGNGNAFVTELNPTGTALVYSTYLGGTGDAGVSVIGTGIAVDSTGAAYVAGNTISGDFPTTPGALQSGGPIFLAKFVPNGTSLAYSTTFGTGNVSATGMAIDGSGAAYVTGYTYPQGGGGITVTPGAYQPTNHSAYQTNAFVAKLNPTGTALGYATYLGGSGRNFTNSNGAISNVADQGNAIAVDGSGNAYITGSAGSEDFPITSGTIQTNNVSPAGLTNAFITKMNPTGTALVYSTYLGGTGSAGAPPVTISPQGYGDQGNAIVVDTAGDAYVAGWTGSADFPVTTNAYQSTNGALANKNTNAFVSKLNPAGSGLLYSTYLGGSGSTADYSQGDSASGVAFDASGHIYVGGSANSSNFPTTTGAFETTGGGGFVSQLDPGAGSQYALSITPATLEVFAGQVGTASQATPVTITNIGSADVTISGISIAGANAAEFTQMNTCGATLEPNNSCTVSVVFKPTTAGNQSATLSIVDNAGNSPQTVALVGNETVYPPDPVLSTTQLAFGTQAAGSSTTQPVTLTNQGKGALDITSIAAGSWWSQTNTCGTTVAAGASCTINVTFTPTYAAGTSASLVIEDNANSSPQQVSLSGSGTAVDVVVSPPSLNFAAQAVGTMSPAQTVTVTNYSAVPITFSSISATGDFAVTNNCNGPMPTNSSCSALVTFKPTASGTRTGTLTVTDSASNKSWQVALNGGVPPITLTPTALTFAAQAVGTTSDVQIVKVANTGQGASYAISSIVVSGDFVWNKDLNFSCEGATLGLYGSCNVEVAFKPTAAGTRTGTLTITDTASNSPQTAALTGTGVGSVTLSATALSFADQAVGSTSVAQVVTVKNTGSTAVTVKSYTFTGTNASDFLLTAKTCSPLLAAGASCTLSIAFKPAATGMATASLVATDSATGSPQTIPLTGTGVALATVSLSPSSLTFASINVGATSAAQVVTVTNTGATAVTVKSYTFTGTNASDFLLTAKTCSTSLAAGASCTLSIAFKPAATGMATASLVATDSASGSPQTVLLTGTGSALATVSFSPNSLTLASTNVGSTSAAQTITVKNTSTTAMTVSSYTFTGTNASAFLLTAKTCSTSLAAGASCTLSIAFKPAATGMATASLVATDSASGSPQTVLLTGTGSALATVSFSPSSLTFASTNVGSTSAAQTITVKNTSTTAMTVSSYTFTGTNASDFLLTAKTCSTSLAAGASCTLSIAFRPAATGTATASLVATDSATGSPQTVILSGTGTTP